MKDIRKSTDYIANNTFIRCGTAVEAIGPADINYVGNTHVDTDRGLVHLTEETVANPVSEPLPTEKGWHETTLGTVTIGVVTILLASAIIWMLGSIF